MRITDDWLQDPAAQRVLALMTDQGHQALVVGGCVRNALMGVAVTDIDIATDARPDRVIALARSAGLRAVPTGIDHGTVTLVADGQSFEVTTFRRDIDTDGRHAKVHFADHVSEDAARRDFTMNALYARADGTVLDPLGGLGDVQARHVRFIGSAAQRIAEDYLRILRFFRFHAQYGRASIDAEGLAACASGLDGLAQISAERIGAEMRKLLAARNPAPCVAAMAQSGVLAQVLAGASATALPVLVHLEHDHPPHWLRRLLVLGGDTDRLRLTRAEARDLATARTAIASLQNLPELGYRHGQELGTDIALARAALLGQPLPQDWQAQITRGADACFPIRAHDLPHLQGPDLGAALKALESRWIAADFRPKKSDLLR